MGNGSLVKNRAKIGKLDGGLMTSWRDPDHRPAFGTGTGSLIGKQRTIGTRRKSLSTCIIRRLVIGSSLFTTVVRRLLGRPVQVIYKRANDDYSKATLCDLGNGYSGFLTTYPSGPNSQAPSVAFRCEGSI